MCGSGDLDENNVDVILDRLNDMFSPESHFQYIMDVLVPTVYQWVMITVGELSVPRARFYLQNGGGNETKAAVKWLHKKYAKNRGICYFPLE